ncbi:MAG TPA: ATP synthase F0 subunit A [Flavobacteriales bacterium]|nr:ATP synthase F0 subunit A [Flavobacteriales bacterium]
MNKILKIKRLFVSFGALFAFLMLAQISMASSSENKHSEKSFNAGETIIHHVQDAHQMHIFDGFTIPLPVILYSEKGLDIFMSSKFHHGTEPYTSSSTGNTYVNEAEHIHEVSGVKIYDLSITKNVIGIFICLGLMFWLFISTAKGYVRNKGKAPSGVQSVMEPLILFIRDEVAKPSIGAHFERFMPFLLTIFFFILISNFLGLIPFLGGMNITGNIAVTMTLAFFTFVITTISANKGYWMHIIKPPGVPLWLLPIMLPIEILGVFSKPIVLMLRLFANITAGHIIILSFTSLIFIFAEKSGTGAGLGVSVLSVAFSIFMNTLELLVAFLQAYVFTLLSALYFGMAVEEHH